MNETKEFSELKGDPKNPRTLSKHDGQALARAMKEFGDLGGVVFNIRTQQLVGGHQRVSVLTELLSGAKQVVITQRFEQPDSVGTVGHGYIVHEGRQYAYREVDWDEGRQRSANIAANRISGEFNLDMLAQVNYELSQLENGADLLALSGQTEDEINKLLDMVGAGEERDPAEDEAPEVDEVNPPVSKLGEIYQLGNHRLMCGDSTDSMQVGRLMAGQRSPLLHADPPYGMNKDVEGVLNDNLHAKKLDAFQIAWWDAFRPYLSTSASAYIWGNAPDLWRLWYVGGLGDSEPLTLRNEIVWAKGQAQGMNSDEFRMYPVETERCLFIMLGEQGFNNNSDNYWEGWEPIRTYLLAERERIGWNNQVIAEWFGFHPRMADHWFSRSQWSFPTREQYETLQSKANGSAYERQYEDLKRQYEDLKQDFYKTRSYFNNTHANMTDVVMIPSVQGDERYGHPTPKPIELMSRLIKTSSQPGAIVIEPFAGSGSTLITADKLGRVCYTMELDPKYCDVIRKRYAKHIGADDWITATPVVQEADTPQPQNPATINEDEPTPEPQPIPEQ